MLSLLSKIWLKYKKTIITSLKLYQISTNQSIIYQNYIWTKYIIFQKKKLSQKYQQQLQQKLQTASVEAATAPAHSAVAPTVVPEIEGSHKDYLIIFSQTMNLIPNIFPPSKRFHSNGTISQLAVRTNSCNSCDSTIKSLTFFFWLKNKIPLMKPLTLSNIFPYLLNFHSTSSNLVTCLALYKEDHTTHQGRSLLSSPIF